MCQYVIVHPENKEADYAFISSNFADNLHYIGAYAPAKDKQVPVPYPISDSNIKETNIDKTGKIELVEATSDGVPHAYLNLSPASAGRDTHAGIFK